MKNFKLIPFVFVATLLSITTSCSKKINEFTQITFGSGGGISGIVTGAKINSKGQIELYKRFANGKEEIVQTKKINKEQLKKINDQIKQLNLYNTKFSEVDNFYYFIEIENNQQINYLSWGTVKKPISGVIDFYQLLEEIKNGK